MSSDLHQNQNNSKTKDTSVGPSDVGPKQPSLKPLLDERRAQLREEMLKQGLDAVIHFSTREHSQPSLWILGAACKSDCHYAFVTPDATGVLEMPWRIAGLKPRLHTEEQLVPVAGAHLMPEALKAFCTERGVKRIGVIGDAPFTHLEKLPAEIVNLNDRFAPQVSAQVSPEVPVGMTARSSLDTLDQFPLTQADRDFLAGRLDSLREEIAKSGVDAALLYGTDRKGQYARWLTAVPTVSESEIIVVTPTAVKIFDIACDKNLDHKRAYPVEHYSFSSREEMQEALKRELEGASTLGVVKEFPYGDLMPLSAGKKLQNINGTIGELMAIKSPQELGIIRHSSRDLATLMEESLAKLTKGMNGKELAAVLDERITLCGSTRSFPIGVAADGDLKGQYATTLAEPLYTQEIHEAVCIDMGIQYAGLVTDGTRMGFIGNPPIKAEYERLREVVRAVIAGIKPGQTVRDFLFSMKASLADAGFDVKTLGVEELGHGVGFDLHEPPFLAIEEHLDMVFKPGMVVCIEPEVKTRWGSIRVEEMVEITATGAEILTIPWGHSRAA